MNVCNNVEYLIRLAQSENYGLQAPKKKENQKLNKIQRDIVNYFNNSCVTEEIKNLLKKF